jgi:hypothetical protein
LVAKLQRIKGTTKQINIFSIKNEVFIWLFAKQSVYCARQKEKQNEYGKVYQPFYGFGIQEHKLLSSVILTQNSPTTIVLACRG